MGKIADLVILNLLFLLTSLPVITVGASLTAVHEVIHKMGEGTEGFVPRTYIRAVIRYFGKATSGWMVLLAAGALLFFDLTIGADFAGGKIQMITLFVAGGLLVLWVLIFPWFFLLQDELEGTLSGKFVYALGTAVKRFPQSLLMSAITLLPIVTYHFFIRFFLGIVLPFYVVIGFSLSAAACDLIAGKITITDRRNDKGGENERAGA